MASIDFSSLDTVTQGLSNLAPSTQDILKSALVGAGVSVVTKGIASGGLASLDPLGLFQKNNAPIAPTNNPAGYAGPTITASAFAALPPASQSALLAAGAHIVAG